MTKFFIIILVFFVSISVYAQDATSDEMLLVEFPVSIDTAEGADFTVQGNLANSIFELVQVSVEYVPDVFQRNTFVPVTYELTSSQHNNQWHITFDTLYQGTWKWVVVASFNNQKFWFYKPFLVE